MKRSFTLPALIAGALLLTPSIASAYCRTANCETHKGAWQVCTPAEPDDCGDVLHWDNRCVGFTLQKDASSQVSLADAEDVFAKAFHAWTSADCGGGAHPTIKVEYQGTVECDLQEYNKEKERGNANIIMFRDDSWAYEGTANILALTTVTYNLDTSEIYDADMEINSHDVQAITLSDSEVGYDLLSIATHEAGHFLGVAHSHDGDATMFTDYKVGTTSLRDLTPDDVSAICAVFPPNDPPSEECDATPRHGFASLCGDDQPPPGGGCAVSQCGTSRGSPERSIAWLTAAAALVALTSRRRRRSTPSQK